MIRFIVSRVCFPECRMGVSEKFLDFPRKIAEPMWNECSANKRSSIDYLLKSGTEYVETNIRGVGVIFMWGLI
jgi:hypothetical protein